MSNKNVSSPAEPLPFPDARLSPRGQGLVIASSTVLPKTPVGGKIPLRIFTISWKAFAHCCRLLGSGAILLALFACALVPWDSTSSSKPKATPEELIHTELSLIKSYLDQGKAAMAWESLRPLYHSHASHPDVLNMVGLTHLSLENHKSAIQVFEKAYSYKPSIAIGLNLSSAYIASGSYRQAQQVLIMLLKSGETYKSYPYKERVWHNLALTLEKGGKKEKALAYYEKAIKINPSFILSLIRIGKIYKSLQKDQLAMQYYQKALQYCPSCYEPLNELASYFLSQGNINAATQLLTKFISHKEASPRERESAKNLLLLAKKIKARNNIANPQ